MQRPSRGGGTVPASCCGGCLGAVGQQAGITRVHAPGIKLNLPGKYPVVSHGGIKLDLLGKGKRPRVWAYPAAPLQAPACCCCTGWAWCGCSEGVSKAC